jgi:hypothetical protein
LACAGKRRARHTAGEEVQFPVVPHSPKILKIDLFNPAKPSTPLAKGLAAVMVVLDQGQMIKTGALEAQGLTAGAGTNLKRCEGARLALN